MCRLKAKTNAAEASYKLLVQDTEKTTVGTLMSENGAPSASSP
jgi:hypothetical protein